MPAIKFMLEMMPFKVVIYITTAQTELTEIVTTWLQVKLWTADSKTIPIYQITTSVKKKLTNNTEVKDTS